MEENIEILANRKIALGNTLQKGLNKFINIPGAQKIYRKIGQEMKFLEKAKLFNKLTINHVMCSNLTHFEYLLFVMLKQRNIVHIDCAFNVDCRSNPIRVDIVCENGSKWIKVIARNSKSINDAAKGGVSFGVKSIIDQAKEYSRAAEQNLNMFQKPQILFYFSQNIDSELKDEIQKYDILIATVDKNESLIDEYTMNVKSVIPVIKILNLDVTTMLAYVSSLTNGSCNWIFRETLLTDQAKRERKTPLKVILDNLFKNKELICCKTAVDSFNNIISILGGPREKERAEILLKMIDIKQNLERIPNILGPLEVCGKIKPRSLEIFAFGLSCKAITVTSNEGFIRSAKMKGINVPVFIHQARALTELKERDGKLICESI